MATNDSANQPMASAARGGRSFYDNLRSPNDGGDFENEGILQEDEENLKQNFSALQTFGLDVDDGNLSGTNDLPGRGVRAFSHAAKGPSSYRNTNNAWPVTEEDGDNDVPASLLVEHKEADPKRYAAIPRPAETTQKQPPPKIGRASNQNTSKWIPRYRQHEPYGGSLDENANRPRAVVPEQASSGRNERAMWRWVNTTNLDSFMRDVYDYYEGGGIWCILCSNALWLL